MIQPINNISFKAIWEKPHNYSIQQHRTIREIKAKIGERALENDYMIEPGSREDKVLLYQLKDLKTSNGTKLSYSKKIYVGAYNEETPFGVKDLKEPDKYLNPQNYNKSAMLVMVALGVFAATLFAILPKKQINHTQEKSIEQITKPAIDSLQKIKKDTINFIK